MAYATLTSPVARRKVARSLQRTRDLIQRYRREAEQAHDAGRAADVHHAHHMEQYYHVTLAGAREILEILYA